jgi:hypothetical protein
MHNPNRRLTMGTIIETDGWEEDLATIEDLEVPVVPWTLAEMSDVDDLSSLRLEASGLE